MLPLAGRVGSSVSCLQKGDETILTSFAALAILREGWAYQR